MVDTNHLTLAVAGSGKTQSIIDACVAADPAQKILVLTYTSANQRVLKQRLASEAGDRHRIEVTGWFSFLIGEFVRPYLPFEFPGKRVRGFDFKSDPQQYVGNDEWRRYFNRQDEVRRVHLAQLAHRVNQAAAGAPIRRLARVYDHIYIDEVQDLCGWDLEILDLLMDSEMSLTMVGDVRQAILVTNNRERKNKQYMYLKVWDWLRRKERAGKLLIAQDRESYRCGPEITQFADSLFSDELGFESTISKRHAHSIHQGIFLVKTSDVDSYVYKFRPLLLRRTASSGRSLAQHQPINIGLAKGMESDHVLIHPTSEIKSMLRTSTALDSNRAAYLYVAVTRAKHSVAFILDDPGDCAFPFWSP